ncbi:hypothetical protein D9758_018027 [Tetrapyrgos nigripes]|uniref:Glucose-methanol-choline oxidoreductase N-terminal domain-containing protein n=1 Tax=Tetrapyrgos nigripes TaxID=182062 RepID=A0A8H5F8V7_9AGAR|nr:hypothetical protein D9758_018027 [Tetrapyrgos nigripes]
MQFRTLVLVSALLPFLSTGYASIVEHVDDLPTQEFDFVVIGGGTAGNVIANRLTENPAVNVLVLEAGGFDENDLNTKVPGFFGRDMGSPLDWNFTANLGLATDNRMGTVARGFVLGGSSAISGMVYTRGSSDDWDRYADLTGDSGWSWDSIQQYIKKNENFTQPSDFHNISGQFDPTVHGFDGISSVTLASYVHKFDNLVIQSSLLRDAEIPFKLDPNDGNNIGLSWGQATILNGERSSSATSYLALQFRKRSNLHILLHAHVTRILRTEDDHETTFSGVEFTQDAGATFQVINATKEIIVSGGAIGSPNILLNSGIGDAETLTNLGILSTLDLPSVGQNYTDQGIVDYIWIVNSTDPNDFLSQDESVREGQLEQWEQNKTGPLADGALVTGCFFRLPDNASIFETVEDPSAGPNSAHIEMVFTSSNVGFPPEAVGNVTNFILVSPNILTPTSLINLNLLSSEFDVFALREGVKAVQRLLATTPFQGFILQSTTNATTDEEIDQFVRETIIAGLHPVGSAAMSQKGADWGVVDPDLKLKGARGVRVVDASVLARRLFGIFLESEN